MVTYVVRERVKESITREIDSKKERLEFGQLVQLFSKAEIHGLKVS